MADKPLFDMSKAVAVDKPLFDMSKATPLDSAPQPATAPAAPPAPSLWDRIKGIPQAWEEQMKPTDDWLAPRPSDGTLDTAAHNFGGAAASTLLAPVMHPWDTAKGVLGSVFDATPPGMLYNAARGGLITDKQQQADAVKDPARAIETGLGQLAGMGAAAGIAPAAEETPGYLHEKAVGDRDTAALRAFREGPRSSDHQSTINDVTQARPYLHGVQNLEDFQSRIAPAQQEIIAPYDQAINALGDKQVQGPDGPTTIKALDDERSQLSAQLRTLKSGGPEAIALAQQKGLTQANLLARQQAVQDALYPHLQDAGINPFEIMSRYGAVSRLGEDMSGQSTRLEKPQPYGFRKFLPGSLNEGLTESLLGGAAAHFGHGEGALAAYLAAKTPGVLRDIVAGRPLLSGSPTDVGMREAFGGKVGPKPDLGQFTPRPESPLGSAYPRSDSAFSRTPVPTVSEPEMQGATSGMRVTPDGQVVLPRLMLQAPEATPQLPASVLPRILPEPHEFVSPYSPRSAGRLLDLENPQATKPTARSYRKPQVQTGTDRGQ